MKNIIGKGIAFFAVLSLFVATNVMAKTIYYINDNGVKMSELEYQQIVDLFSENKAKYISQEEFDKYINMDIISSTTIYEKITYADGEVIDRESVTKEEYDNAPTTPICADAVPYSDTYQFIETDYKKITGQLVYTNGLHIVSTLSWKQVPKYKSYDVYAMRFQFLDYSNVYGQQTYYTSGGSGVYTYSSSSEGYKGFSDGFGISMNLKDGSNITGYDLALDANLSVQSTTSAQAHAWITYQHAQKDVTRAQSKSYTMSISGLGNVLYYSDTTIRGYYDGMSGLFLTHWL